MLLTVKKYILRPIFFVVFLSCIAGIALLHPGLPPTHDGEYHIIRFYEFNKTLQGGDLYPRWASDLNKGYGVPLFNYVYPLPNYVASFLHVFGISFIYAFKLSMFLAILLGGIFIYLWTKMFWGSPGGVVSSVFYTFAPYHFLDIYIRGSIGEVWALAFFPAFLWSTTELFQKKKAVFVILSGIFLSLIIFSHNILALMFMPVAISYMTFMIILSKQKLYAIRYSLYAFFLGFGLSAIFWLPALLEIKYVTGLQIYDIKNNFPEFYQLLIPSWGTGFSGGDVQNQMSFQIGIANLGAILGSIAYVYFGIKRKDKDISVTIFFLIWLAFVLFLMLKNSLFLWEKIVFMHYFQFPWRFLSLVILFCAFLAGSIVRIGKKKIVAFTMIFFSVILGIGYAKPAFYHYRDDNYYITRSNFIDGTNSPGNLFNTIWFNQELKKQKIIISIKDRKIISTVIKPTTYTVTLFLKSDSNLTVNTAYFPGWEVFVDGKKTNIFITNKGLISFFLDQGSHEVKIQFNDTIPRKIGKIITLVFFTGLLFILIRKRNDIM